MSSALQGGWKHLPGASKCTGLDRMTEWDFVKIYHRYRGTPLVSQQDFAFFGGETAVHAALFFSHSC